MYSLSIANLCTAMYHRQAWYSEKQHGCMYPISSVSTVYLSPSRSNSVSVSVCAGGAYILSMCFWSVLYQVSPSLSLSLSPSPSYRFHTLTHNTHGGRPHAHLPAETTLLTHLQQRQKGELL